MSKNPITRVNHWIARLYSTPLRLALLFAAAGFLWLFNFSSLPLSNPELVKLSGHEGLLDLMHFYSAQEAFTALKHYGASGRELYLRFLAADFIFIPVYSLGFALLMTRIFRAVCSEPTPWLWLIVMPLGIGLFDCIENFSILGMLGLYPDANVMLGTLSGIFTLCKHLLTLTTLLTLCYGGLILVLRKFGLKLCAARQQ